jgi:hypothetical protein
MNKQEAIEKLEYLKRLLEQGSKDSYNNGFINGLKYTLDVVKELKEQEKPKVPQFVAEYIEYCKHEKFYAINGAYNNMDDRLKCWRFKGDNSELFARAWLYGYEVEKEKRYTVEIPNPNGDGYSKTFLGKFKDDKVELCKWSCYTSIEFADNWKQEEYAQLTESEIKKDFDWAWQFAEEVNDND